MTAFHQQQIMLSELDRKDLDPRRNFLRDLKGFLRKRLNDKATIVKQIILGDWNEECTATSNSQQLCDEFGLIDVWASIHPGAEQVKTYLRWSRQIDFALSFPETATCITNIFTNLFITVFLEITEDSL